MQTTKRFTPNVLDRFHREGRGLGSFETFGGWHKVSRGDPSSRGYSALLNWRGRLRDLLSTGELCAQLFVSMLPNLVDVREQFPLAREFTLDRQQLMLGLGGDGPIEPGTLQSADDLGLRHPVVREHGRLAVWVMTTDLLLFFDPPQGKLSSLAVSIKDRPVDPDSRQWELLAIEHDYWTRRGVPWILITPDQWDRRVLHTIQRLACWALGEPVSTESRRLACDIARANPTSSVTDLVRRIGRRVREVDAGERALWQAVWVGELPVDLRRGWRPHVPLKHISAREFSELNPIAARRSAWI